MWTVRNEPRSNRDRIKLDHLRRWSRIGSPVETELVLLLSIFSRVFSLEFRSLICLPFLFFLKVSVNILLYFEFTMAKRGETCSTDEVLALISIWSDESILKMLATCHKNTDIYGKISTKLETLGFKRNLKQCRTNFLILLPIPQCPNPPY